MEQNLLVPWTIQKSADYTCFLQHVFCCPEVENNEGMSQVGFLRYIK